MRKICLLLSAAIEVKNTSLVKRNNTKERLNDYKESLKKWLMRQRSLDKIVFVEDSGYPLDELKEIVKNYNPYNKEVEFISFEYSAANDKNTSMGTIMCVDYALKHSNILKSCDSFVNVTGRVFIKNIDKIVGGLYDDFHMVSRLSENLMYVDSVIVIFDKNCYWNLINDFAIRNMKSGGDRIDLESIYAKALHYILSRNYRWYPFSHEPIMEGMSGAKNIPYSTRYNWRRALLVDIISFFYYRVFRTAYNRKQKKEHILSRWNIPPELN